ncbi:hypothetical protein EMIT051CA3_70360 [Pseudomonas chlororaphis]
MTRFHGVATRYLPSYLGWRRMLEGYQQGIRPDHCIQEAVGRTMQRAIGTWLYRERFFPGTLGQRFDRTASWNCPWLNL